MYSHWQAPVNKAAHGDILWNAIALIHGKTDISNAVPSAKGLTLQARTAYTLAIGARYGAPDDTNRGDLRHSWQCRRAGRSAGGYRPRGSRSDCLSRRRGPGRRAASADRGAPA